VVVACCRDFAAELVRVLGEEAQALGREWNVPRDGVAHRPRGTHGFQRAEICRIGLDQSSPAAHHASAFTRCTACPVAVAPGIPCVAHGGVHRVGVGQWKLGMRLRIGGPVHHDTAGVGHEAPTDEMARRHVDLSRVEGLHGRRLREHRKSGDRS
jgi:hypothetical protein